MNHLKMNDYKTELITFETRSLLDKSPLASICIDKSEIEKSSCIKFLGAHMDDILSFKIMLDPKPEQQTTSFT